MPIRTELDRNLAGSADGGNRGLVIDVSAPPDEHMNILQTMLELHAAKTGRRRGPARQQPRRALEQVVRRRAVQCVDRLLERGCRQHEAAQRLAVNERTLRHWTAQRGLAPSLRGAAQRRLAPSLRGACPLGADAAPAPLLGRPLAPSDAAQQQAVVSWLDTIGPGVGVPTLRTHFDGLARAELDELLKTYRRRWREENRRLIHVLHWQRPATVWAMDFAEAPRSPLAPWGRGVGGEGHGSPLAPWGRGVGGEGIDGVHPYLLAVRDLASGQQLLWQPVAAPTAAVVVAELQVLFAQHGAPLVLKTDNGSAFIADELRWILHRSEVFQLFSPPRTPEYNGAIEASIGSLKTRTERKSMLAGHPGVWTSADVEAAQLEANLTARPRRLHGATPDQVWQARRPLTAAERTDFQATVAKLRLTARLEQDLPAAGPLTRTEQAMVDRAALRRALVAHDLLLFRRRRIPPRIKRPKAASEG